MSGEHAPALEPQHPKPDSLDVNFVEIVDDRQPVGPGDGGFRSTTRKSWNHTSPLSPYSDSLVNTSAYAPVDLGKPTQDLCFTSPDLREYYSEDLNRVPDEYVAAEYVRWAIGSYLPPSSSSQGQRTMLPADISTEDIAAVFKRITSANERAHKAEKGIKTELSTGDTGLLEALRAVATDHFISERLAAGKGTSVPYEESDPTKTGPRALPLAIRKLVQVVPYLDADVQHATKMGRHLAKTRRDAAHFKQTETAIDPFHPGMQLPDDKAEKIKNRQEARKEAAHHLQENAKYFVEQAFRRAPELAAQIITAVKRNTQEDYDALPKVEPAPYVEPQLPVEKHTFKYEPLSDQTIGDKYVDAWGVLHKFGDEATLTWNPNNKSLTDGSGVRLISYRDDVTELHLPRGTVEVEGSLDFEHALSLRRQLYEAGRFAGHLIVDAAIEVSLLESGGVPEGLKVSKDDTGKTVLIQDETNMDMHARAANQMTHETAYIRYLKKRAEGITDDIIQSGEEKEAQALRDSIVRFTRDYSIPRPINPREIEIRRELMRDPKKFSDVDHEKRIQKYDDAVDELLRLHKEKSS